MLKRMKNENTMRKLGSMSRRPERFERRLSGMRGMEGRDEVGGLEGYACGSLVKMDNLEVGLT